MLILTGWFVAGSTSVMAVFLARIVIPRSRSRSFESITRSATCWFSRNVCDWRRRPSTRVVLPWSTCAMMAIFRRSVRSTNIHSPDFKCLCEPQRSILIILGDCHAHRKAVHSQHLHLHAGASVTHNLHTKTPGGEAEGFTWTR